MLGDDVGDRRLFGGYPGLVLNAPGYPVTTIMGYLLSEPRLTTTTDLYRNSKSNYYVICPKTRFAQNPCKSNRF